MNSRTDAVNNMNPVETSSAVPKPVKYIVFNNQMNMDKTIEKTSMVMEALKAYSSRNDVNIMPANSSIKNGKIMCLSTSKSQNLFESTSTAQNFNPVFSNSSSFKVNDSWVRLQNTFDLTEPHPVAISYPITNNKSIKWNPKPSDQPKKIFLPNTAEPNLVGHPNMINLSIQKKNKPSCHKIRFVKRNELPKDQSKKILLPNTAEPYPVGPPFMNEKSLKENPKSSDKNLSLLQGHGSVNKQSLMVTSLNDISCYPQLKLRDGQPGLQNSVLLHPVPNQYAQKNLNEQSEANLQGLHSVATVMNHNDPIVFAEFKKHFTLSTKNKMFRNELLASTKAANFDKTAMDTILFNLVNACEKHVFDQNVHMHVIKNIACEIAEIPGYEKHADKIRSQCHHILAETFNDMNGLVDQCVKLKNVQTKIDSDKTTSKTEPIPEINNILFPSDHFKPKLIGETGYIKIEPEDSENDVDMPVADENVEEENQMEFSTHDNQVKPIYNKEIEKIVNEDRDQIESGNEDRDQIESGNEDRDQIESRNEERDQIKSENEDCDQIESGNEDRDQMKSENEDHDQIESRNEDRDQIESGNVDGCEIKSIYEDYRQKELENEDGGQPKTIYEDYVQIEWKNEDGGKIESEMEEEEYIDNNIESVYSENRTEQINTLNFNEHSVEAQPDAAEGYSDKISENENESSELEENETEFIDENDPDWQPSQHFESSGTAKRSREPKKPKVPKKSKERKMPQAKGGICNTCGKKVKYLKEHLVTHMTERPEKCLYCDYRAKCPKSLRLHIAVHRSERNFQCEKCGLLFPRLAGVKFHLETVHSEELPFSCQFCQKKYKRKFALNLHEKIHKKQFAFTCNVCGKKFIQSGNLKTHMRTHTGEKPYKCDKCGEGFAHNVTKKLHRKTCFVEKVREKSDQD